MKTGYFVTDDGMIAEQGIATLEQAISIADSIIKGLPFGDVGRWEILKFDGITSKTVRRFEAVVDWEMV